MILIGRVRTETRTSDGAAGSLRLGARTLHWRARRVDAELVLEIEDYLPLGMAWKWHGGRWLNRGPFGGPYNPLPSDTAAFWAPLLEHVERTLLGWRPELVRGGLAGLGALPWDRHLGPAPPPTLRDLVQDAPPVRDPRARMLALVAVAVPAAPAKVRAAIFERALELRRQGARDPIRAAVLHEAALAVAASGAPESRVLASWGWNPEGLVAGTER